MKDKPLDFPREYFEVYCTTAEKKYFEYMAYRYTHSKKMSDFILQRMLGMDLKSIYSKDEIWKGLTEEQKIEKWEKKLAEAKAVDAKHRKEGMTKDEYMDFFVAQKKIDPNRMMTVQWDKNKRKMVDADESEWEQVKKRDEKRAKLLASKKKPKPKAVVKKAAPKKKK